MERDTKDIAECGFIRAFVEHPNPRMDEGHRKSPPVRVDRNSNLFPNAFFVLPGADLLRRGGLPDFGGVVVAGSDDLLTVGRKSD